MSNVEIHPVPVDPSSTGRTLDYAVLDVFAERPLEGNPLAVFTDARGLSTGDMQALARETNLSETTFIVPRAAEVERECGVQVRIFTVDEELDFAGHPTLGTATWLQQNHPGMRAAEVITLDLRAGRVPVHFRQPEPGSHGVFGTMRQRNPEFGDVHDRRLVAAAIGVSPEDLDPHLPVQLVSTGLAFCIVPLRSLAVAAGLRVPQSRAMDYLKGRDAKFFHCITRARPGCGADWHARMQFPSGEDPATGSASGCAVAYLVRHGVVPSEVPIVIEQGIEILRPSRIHAQATLNSGTVSDVFVGGRTIPVATGRFFLP